MINSYLKSLIKSYPLNGQRKLEEKRGDLLKRHSPNDVSLVQFKCQMVYRPRTIACLKAEGALLGHKAHRNSLTRVFSPDLIAMSANAGAKKNRITALKIPPNREETIAIFKALWPSCLSVIG